MVGAPTTAGGAPFFGQEKTMSSFAKAMVAAAVAVCLVPTAAQAQTASKVAEDVKKLRTDVELMKATVVQVPTLAQAVQDIDGKLAIIEQRLAKLETQKQAMPDAVTGIDDLGQRVAALEQDMATVKTAVAGLERPGVASGGGSASRNGSFQWETPDGKYGLKLGGYGQIRGEFGFDNADAGETVDESNLRIRRARLQAQGHLGSQDFKYKLMFDTTKSPSVHDFYADYKLHDGVWVRAGQFKTQFMRNFVTSSSRLAFVDRTGFVEGYRYDRDVQVGVFGAQLDDRLGYFVSLGNGAGRAKTNDNIDFNQTVMVEYAILGKLVKPEEGDRGSSDEMSVVVTASAVHDLVAMPDEVAGIAVNADVDGNGTTDNVRVVSASVGAAFRYRGIGATAEWALRRESWGTILDHPDNAALEVALNDIGGDTDVRNYQGFYLQGTYMALPERLMVGGRFAHSRNTLLRVGGRALSSPPLASRLMELSVLAQLYDDRVDGRLLGIMYTLSNHNAKSGPDPDGDIEHRVVVETQLQF
jgi:outer membrane lipoprotein-sorting protein